MWPYAEFFAGFATLVVGLTGTGIALRHGRRAARASFGLALVIEALVIAGLFLDWGYAWFNRTALDIALNSNIWVALPHALALMVLMATFVWGPGTAPWSVVLAAVQSASFPPVIFLVELDTDASFLSAAPLASMYLSVLAAFFLLPEAWSSLPREGSRWFAIAFGPRAHLIEAIRSLAALGFSVSPPETVLESGQAVGRIGATEVLVTSRPSLLPPAYALRIRWTWTHEQPGLNVSRPGFARSEQITPVGRSCDYVGLSRNSFEISPSSLSDFLVAVARPGPPAPAGD